MEFNVNLHTKNCLGFYSDILIEHKLDVSHMAILNQKLKQPKTILDIGTNDGAHSVYYRKCFPDANLYAFEPDPRAIMQFKKNLEPYQNWKLYEGAISDKAGSIVLNLAFMGENNWSLSSSIADCIPGHHSLSFPYKMEVPTTTLNQWVKDEGIDLIDFAHTDLQGSEKKFISGASEAFKIIRYIMLEYGEKANYPEALSKEKTIELMAEHNFKDIINNNKNLLFENQEMA